MGEPFKNQIDAAAVARVGSAFAAVVDFDAAAFGTEATAGLDALELKARVAHVAAALRQHLPAEWTAALEALVIAEVEGFAAWPLLDVVQEQGLDHPEASLDALAVLTGRWSAEFAIRPYLLQHPEITWARLDRWVDSDDLDVRRLCSEGTRPRLPWGVRLNDAIADPSRGLALLDRLVDDAEEYVRRSVANHLNDVSKDHPERAVAVAKRWLDEDPERLRTVRHALRSRIKAADPDALAVLGFGPPQVQLQNLRVTPDPVAVGGSVRLEAAMTAEADQRWIVDWVVTSPGARKPSRRVVKGSERAVTPGAVTVSHSLSLKPVTTRKTRPGPWSVALQVNGRVLGEVAFEVTPGS